MFVTTDKATIEYAKRAAQAVLQYQEYKAGRLDAAIEKGRSYATDALGGFVQPIVNAPVNIVNGVSEPFRAAERLSFGTKYITEIPRMQVAERSEYWNKDGRMYINTGAEITSTIVFGGAAGGKAIGTQAGKIFLGTESVYNIAAGTIGKDVTHPDAQNNARQMPWYEQGLRVTGGIFGARQAINTEIAAPNSITNRAVDKLDDIFKNNPTFKPQGELVTPEGFRIKAATNPGELDGIEKAGNTFEMRAKKTLSGVAPEEQVVNALKTEFKPIDYKFGNNTFKLSRTGMKHILERHHPEFWSGTVKDKQSYFAAKTTIEELQNVITSVLKQNRETLAGRGAVRAFQVEGNVNGVKYILGIDRGQVKQLFVPQK